PSNGFRKAAGAKTRAKLVKNKRTWRAKAGPPTRSTLRRDSNRAVARAASEGGSLDAGDALKLARDGSCAEARLRIFVSFSGGVHCKEQAESNRARRECPSCETRNEEWLAVATADVPSRP